jgi:cytochrome P450
VSDDNEFAFDLFDPKQTQHMWDLMAKMRQQCPVAHPAEGFSYTARYDDTERVFRDARTFSCAGGFRAAGVDIPVDELFLAEMDPPLHPKLRKFLLRFFNPAMAAKAEVFTRSYVGGLFEQIAAKGGGNIVAELSTPVPVAVTGHVLGVPLEDIATLADRLFELLHTDWPAYGLKDRSRPGEGVDLAGSAPELVAYFDQMIEARRGGQVVADDLIAQLVATQVDGEWLTKQRIRSLAINFLTAGLSTTNLISNLLYRLMTSEDFDATVRNDRGVIPAAVEESLRFEPPVLFLFRTVTGDVGIADRELPAGERVVMGIASANRDETVFDDADRFRINAADPEHLAFGAGPHLCLGNHMARMEGRVVVEEYLDRFGPGELALTPEYEYELMAHFLEYGPERLDVVVNR